MTDHIRIGVNALVIKDNKVLLGVRLSKAGHGMWGVPGGHLEVGESMIEGIKRELKEETGIDATELEFIQLINDPRQDFHYIQINFLVKAWTGEPKVMEPDKCEKWEWFDLDNLPKNIFYGHEKFLPSYKSNIHFIG